MRPYTFPDWVKTKRRCMYRLPGMAYNCRSIGCFVLNGRGYCAHHYDVSWRTQNPEQGQAHLWHFHVNRFTGELDKYESCKRCGNIRQREGLPFTPCDGKMPTIELR